MKRSQLFLLITGLILLSIGVTYGTVPEGSMNLLYGLQMAKPGDNLIHMLRGFSGLYLAMGLFWIIGSTKKTLINPALWSVVIFMSGVAAGRLVSFVVDGIPTFYGFNLFFVCELVLAAIASGFIRSDAKDN